MTDGTQVIELNYTPRPQQRELADLVSRHRFNVVITHRRFGKSFFAGATLVTAALSQPGCYAWIAPTLKQARAVSWPILEEVTRGLPGVEFKPSENTVQFSNGSQIILASSELYTNLRGYKLHGIVWDEVAFAPRDAWQAIRPCLSDTGGWLVAITTPHGLDNLAYEFWQRALDPNQPDWAGASYPASQTGILSDAELKSARETADSPQAYEAEYECSFEAGVANSLLQIDDISAAMRRATKAEGEIAHHPRIVGVDPARMGGDRTMIARRWGPQALPFISVEADDLVTQAGVIAHHAMHWRADAIIVDQGGLGAGLLDILQHKFGLTDVLGVDFGGKPVGSEKALNRRAEMYLALRDWMTEGKGVLPDDHGLMVELSAPRFEYTSANKLQLEAKDKIRQRTNKSPDRADALAVTFAFPWIQPKTEQFAPHSPFAEKPQSAAEYDPFQAEDL